VTVLRVQSLELLPVRKIGGSRMKVRTVQEEAMVLCGVLDQPMQRFNLIRVNDYKIAF
jgi:hypothetical protein